jgi:hypothetical protein
MFKSIVGAILAALKTVPIIDRWLTRTPSEQLEKATAEDRSEMDEFRKSGRPGQ